MGKEEEGRTVSPGPDGGFYNLPREVFSPADTPILAEASVMAVSYTHLTLPTICSV